MIKNTRTRRDKKRAEAEARQALYDRLTLDEKLLRTKPGTNQYGRLMAKKASSK
jgi:hypothetical protein